MVEPIRIHDIDDKAQTLLDTIDSVIRTKGKDLSITHIIGVLETIKHMLLNEAVED